jgi:hypothetical protein
MEGRKEKVKEGRWMARKPIENELLLIFQRKTCF